MGLITNRLNSLKDLFRQNGRTTIPTDAQYNALSPGYTTMQLRRTFGSKKRAFNIGLIRAKDTNPAPTVANAIADRSVNENTAWTFQFAADVFADADGQTAALVYSATLSDGSALPAWMTFTPGTRTFAAVTVTPTVTVNTPFIIRVTATDVYGASAVDEFTLTVNNV